MLSQLKVAGAPRGKICTTINNSRKLVFQLLCRPYYGVFRISDRLTRQIGKFITFLRTSQCPFCCLQMSRKTVSLRYTCAPDMIISLLIVADIIPTQHISLHVAFHQENTKELKFYIYYSHVLALATQGTSAQRRHNTEKTNSWTRCLFLPKMHSVMDKLPKKIAVGGFYQRKLATLKKKGLIEMLILRKKKG